MTLQRNMRWIMVLTLALPLLSTSGAFAEVADCAAIAGIDKKESYRAVPSDVYQCAQRGFDPPRGWRPNNGQSPGVSASGGSGFSYGTVQAPQNSPGAVGAGSSVSSSLMNFVSRFTQSNGEGGGSPSTGTGDGAGSGSTCPVANDNSGTYGSKQGLSDSAVSLSCGGSVPLTSYEMVLNSNARGGAVTERGSYYIWVYKKSGDAYVPSEANPVRMPTYLCRPVCDGEGNCSMQKSVDLNPPVAQFVSYNASMSHFLVRLVPLSEGSEAESGLIPLTETSPDKYLLVPIVNGVPRVPVDCDLQDDYYKEIDSLLAEMIINAAVNQSCEDNADVNAGTRSCTGSVSATTANASCNTLSLYPRGNAGGNVCDGKVQYAVTDRTTLVYPPGSTPRFSRMEGRSAVLAPMTGSSKIYAQAQTIFQIRPTAPAFSLPEGGTFALNDRSRLVANASATFTPSNNRLVMTGGGVLVNSGGRLIQRFPNNSVYTIPNPTVPLRLQLGSSIVLPEGYVVLTQPEPYVRLPIDKPQ